MVANWRQHCFTHKPVSTHPIHTYRWRKLQKAESRETYQKVLGGDIGTTLHSLRSKGRICMESVHYVQDEDFGVILKIITDLNQTNCLRF